MIQADYNNDGCMDLLVLRGACEFPVRKSLLRNNCDGTFTDVTKEAGLAEPANSTPTAVWADIDNDVLVYSTMGANFGDVDIDGFLDIDLGTGGPEYGFLIPKVLLRIDEGKSFVDISSSAGIGDLHKGHGTAFADLENSGQQDLLTSMGGATPGDAHAFRVFKSPGNDNDWIDIKLVGLKTNRATLGVRIRITVENKGRGTRSIFSRVTSRGSFGASPLAQHIGLGKSGRILDLEVFWPASNTSQNFSKISPNQFIQISEFAREYKVLTPKRFRLRET